LFYRFLKKAQSRTIHFMTLRILHRRESGEIG
jgi:hypothetical protein